MRTLFLITFLIPSIGFSQLTDEEVREIANNASEEELVMRSTEMIQQNFLYHAEFLVDRLLEIKPQSANYNYRKGFIIYTAHTDYVNGIKHFQNAVVSVKKNYDPFTVRETGAPYDAYYYLAKCYHLDEKLDDAENYYNLFIQNTNKQSRLKDLAELGLKQLDVARREMANPRSAIVKNIGNVVNGPEADYAPVVSLDGNSLYFTSRRKWDNVPEGKFRDPMLYDLPEDIFVSYADFDGVWTEPTRVEFCVDSLNEATISVSADERRIFVYEDRSGNGDIYYSDIMDNGRFDEMQKLRYSELNSEFWDTHCTMTPDGQYLYFASDRPGGYGGRDIYRLTRLPNGEWSKAQNMGSEINTPYDEDSPFIAVNNKTLYYSSNGPSSMGGFDVFVSFRDEENNWSTPANMGFPINSTGDDIYYTTTVDGLRGYLSSFRKDGYGEKDIYEIQNDYLGNRPISSLKGQYVMLDGSPLPNGLDVKLVCSNCEIEADKNFHPRVKNEGRFFAPLKRCKDYEIQFYQGSELLETRNFVTACNSENEEIQQMYYLGQYKLEASVADIQTLDLLPGSKVIIYEAGTKNVLHSFDADANALFPTDLIAENKPGDRLNWDIHIEKDDYLTQTFKLDTVLGVFGTLELQYLLNKAELGTDIGAVFKLNPIYFDLDKSDIRPDAAMELDKIVAIMNENPNLKIELGSHTDCRASRSYNQRLSQRRAKSSAAYIKERITDPSRINGKGYGESQLVNDCGCEGNVVSDCTEEEHQANRRTEFRIVK
jgi:outer membrane protein OmpA-like peptidoglycan-associated protein/tetratricopeptide (TPR) repeat protein